MQLVPGQQLDVWGPLGNGFDVPRTEDASIVAGGIGHTPFVAFAQEHLGRKGYGDPVREFGPGRRATLCYGVRTAAMLSGIDDFRDAGAEVHVATDDGSAGYHGLVTDLLRGQLDATDPPSCPC